MEYQPSSIESKWKSIWKSNQIYRVEIDLNKPKYYVLDMFPYPSGSGLHVGHPLGYIASDILARKKRMEGFQVLHPMGFDAFGLPAEQFAIQTGVHPSKSTYENIERYRQQLHNIGLSFDWSREVITCDPSYYRWTQWIFLKLFNHYYDLEANKAMPISKLIEHFSHYGSQNLEAVCSEHEPFSSDEWMGKTPKQKDELLMNYRLAYRKTAYVNWCEALGTVLANDEIKDGVSERGGHPVEKKPMMQWALRITAYAERLLSDLDSLDWSEALKTMQRNWIGKSVGAQLQFRVKETNHIIEVFSTRPDTIFGASFIVLAPEHPLVDQLNILDQESLIAYRKYCAGKSEKERAQEQKTVTGFNTGHFAVHPFTGDKLAIWISEYVLIEYGTGAIMGVPAHDKRDLAFAKQFQMEFKPVIQPDDLNSTDIESKSGHLINSDFLNGLPVHAAIEKVIEQLEEKKLGIGKVQYKMRDANFSRQRYWGEPIPIIYDQEGCTIALQESELPLTLPNLTTIEPGEGGKSPLSRATDWMNLGSRTRESDTMPGYAGSSWYFLRYMDPQNTDCFASKEAIDYWKDVDFYIGGTEHAVGHLMYSRFWHKFLYDLAYVPTLEPFKKLVNQGMIQGIVESIFLVKISEDGRTDRPLFISASLAGQYPEEALAKIPIHISFVSEYNTPQVHLKKSGLTAFIHWKPEFKNAIFQNETEKGTLEELTDNFRLKTFSETGKMSKRYHNVVNPDDVIAEYGADCFRMYEMFLGPVEQSKPWDTKGIDGVFKFLKRYYTLYYNEAGQFFLSEEPATKEELTILHTCIKKVNSDIDQLNLNTSISAFMICVNELRKMLCNKRAILIPLAQLMAPFAPFITEEIWSLAGELGTIHASAYPKHNDGFLQKEMVNYPISINGKRRMEWEISKTLTEVEIQQNVIQLPELAKWIGSSSIKTIIVVPGRMINIVLA